MSAIRLCLIAAMLFALGVLFYAVQVLLTKMITGVGGSPEPAYQLASSLVSNFGELQLSVGRLGSYL